LTTSLRRTATVYGAFAVMVPKLYLAYNAWAVMEFVVQIFMMVIFVAFWRAVYANATSLGGLSLEQTISYILLAQIIAPLVQSRLILEFGGMLRHGAIAIELLRPVDYQARSLVETMTSFLVFAIQKVPLLLIAWGFLGLRLPSDPRAWVAFAISLILGQVVLFFTDWIFACLAFYSTETWGLSVVKIAVATFFSGALVPLAIMPDWMRAVAMALPFAQGLAIPVSFLSGVTAASQILPLAATQAAWILGLGIASRLVFRHAVRRVTVQGG
jgi:ABC-2 type transport system permease protein